jgi:hypothetical protein
LARTASYSWLPVLTTPTCSHGKKGYNPNTYSLRQRKEIFLLLLTSAGKKPTGEEWVQSPDRCPGRDKLGLLCYSKCPGRYTRFGADCHQNYPSGFRDDGFFSPSAVWTCRRLLPPRLPNPRSTPRVRQSRIRRPLCFPQTRLTLWMMGRMTNAPVLCLGFRASSLQYKL